MFHCEKSSREQKLVLSTIKPFFDKHVCFQRAKISWELEFCSRMIDRAETLDASAFFDQRDECFNRAVLASDLKQISQEYIFFGKKDLRQCTGLKRGDGSYAVELTEIAGVFRSRFKRFMHAGESTFFELVDRSRDIFFEKFKNASSAITRGFFDFVPSRQRISLLFQVGSRLKGVGEECIGCEVSNVAHRECSLLYHPLYTKMGYQENVALQAKGGMVCMVPKPT